MKRELKTRERCVAWPQKKTQQVGQTYHPLEGGQEAIARVVPVETLQQTFHGCAQLLYHRVHDPVQDVREIFSRTHLFAV